MVNFGTIEKVGLLRIRMTGDRESKRQVANPGLPVPGTRSSAIAVIADRTAYRAYGTPYE